MFFWVAVIELSFHNLFLSKQLALYSLIPFVLIQALFMVWSLIFLKILEDIKN